MATICFIKDGCLGWIDIWRTPVTPSFETIGPCTLLVPLKGGPNFTDYPRYTYLDGMNPFIAWVCGLWRWSIARRLCPQRVSTACMGFGSCTILIFSCPASANLAEQAFYLPLRVPNPNLKHWLRVSRRCRTWAKNISIKTKARSDSDAHFTHLDYAHILFATATYCLSPGCDNTSSWRWIFWTEFFFLQFRNTTCPSPSQCTILMFCSAYLRQQSPIFLQV